MLERILRSGAEVKVLGVVLFREGLHMRGIAKEAGISPCEAKKELDNLIELGVLKKEKKGNMLLFYINENCNFIKELRGIYQKTEGLGKEIDDCLRELDGIRYAFIFGSTASGKIREKSDLDLIVIGEISDEKLSEEIFHIQKKNKREINFILWNNKDFEKKLKEKSKFLKNISKNKKWIVGDKDEFERIIKKTFN